MTLLKRHGYWIVFYDLMRNGPLCPFVQSKSILGSAVLKGSKTEAATFKAANVENLTSFYVSNLPGDALNKEIWKSCASLENLSDIYIAGRRDSSGSFFALFKFATVKDKKEIDNIVKGLNEITCRGRKLVANCAIHPKRAYHVTSRRSSVIAPRVFKPAPRGTRSFAEVTKGMTEVAKMVAASLEGISEVLKWADKSVLVGEVRNYELICNFPTLLDLEGYDVLEVKYIRVMQVAVKFRSERSVEVFKANKCIWLKWFIWVDLFGKVRSSPGRIAWIKIVGVPIPAWDESNFAAIAESFGKVLVNVAPFWNCSDVSSGKLCILTHSLKRINEEIPISFVGVIQSVRVYEVDDDWVPFRPSSHSSSDESEEESDDGDEFSVSSDKVILEEGKFVPSLGSGGAVANEPPVVDKEGILKKLCVDVHEGNKEVHGFDGALPHDDVVLETALEINGRINSTCGLDLGEKGGSADTNWAKYVELPHTPRRNDEAISPDFEMGGSGLKRRRTKLKALFSSFDSRVRLRVSRSSPHDNSLDLNRRTPQSPSNYVRNDGVGVNSTGNPNSPSLSSSSMEVDQTIEVGKQVGFQIARGNPTLKETLCGGGVKPGLEENSVSPFVGCKRPGSLLYRSESIGGGAHAAWVLIPLNQMAFLVV
ncbi:unnamed protein product [Lactuca virosa]|uniref:RRM domain-containing protein n=1 Tax=Lactuca virosa TaxID=75947 RepID=A0AAU9P3Q9_9ASTR|nr:unnamed protein product [Lactuca virosa]